MIYNLLINIYLYFVKSLHLFFLHQISSQNYLVLQKKKMFTTLLIINILSHAFIC